MRTLPYFALGHRFDTDISVEEAFARADLRWNARFEDVAAGPNFVTKIPGAKAIVRNDTNQPLSVVGERYHIIQNSDIEALLDNAIGFKVRAAGHIDNGRRCFAVLVPNQYHEFDINGDPWNSYLVVRWNHDGGGSVKYGLQFWRQWCTNGQKRIEGQHMWSIPHFTSARNKLDFARSTITQLQATVNSFVSYMTELYDNKHWSGTEVRDLLQQVIPKPEMQASIQAHRAAVTRWQRTVDNIWSRFYLRSDGLPPNTYSLVQTINEYEQWSHGRSTNRAKTMFNRLDTDRWPLTARTLELVRP